METVTKEPNRWVTAEKFCQLTGDSPKAIYVRRSKGLWIDGVHAKKVPGMGLMVNLEEVNKWIENCQSASQ